MILWCKEILSHLIYRNTSAASVFSVPVERGKIFGDILFAVSPPTRSDGRWPEPRPRSSDPSGARLGSRPQTFVPTSKAVKSSIQPALTSLASFPCLKCFETRTFSKFLL